MGFLPVSYINRYKTIPTFACWSPPLPSPFLSLNLHQEELCPRHTLAYTAKPPAHSCPFVSPQTMTCTGWWLDLRGVYRLGRGVHRPESDLGRKFLEPCFRRNNIGFGVAGSLHCMKDSPYGEGVCLQERQRESLNQ